MEKEKKEETEEKRKSGYGKGFIDFVREQGIVGLAIGLAIGTQATAFSRAIVESMITPVVNLIVGPEGLSGLTWTVTVGSRTSTFHFGLLINAMIQFLAVTLVVYIAFRILRLDRLDKKKES